MNQPQKRKCYCRERGLYLDLRKPGKYRVPETVEIPQPKMRSAIPVLAD